MRESSGLAAAGRVVAVAMLWALGGCLLGVHSSESRSGNYVAESTFNQIEEGKTTAGWVKATLGEPTEIVRADESEIWKWNYTEKRTSGGYVFLIFGGSGEKTTTGGAYVELKDGVVVRKWRS